MKRIRGATNGQRGPKEDGAHFAQGRSLAPPSAVVCICRAARAPLHLLFSVVLAAASPSPNIKRSLHFRGRGQPSLGSHTKNNSNAHSDFCPHSNLSLQNAVDLSGHANCERVRRRRRKVICGRDRARRVLARLRPPTNQPCHHWQWRWEEEREGRNAQKGPPPACMGSYIK